MSIPLVDKMAAAKSMEECARLEFLGRAFMRENQIADPGEVTMVYQQAPGLAPKFSHFKHTPFNNHGDGI